METMDGHIIQMGFIVVLMLTPNIDYAHAHVLCWFILEASVQH